MNFENIVIFPPNDNRFLTFVPNVINLYTLKTLFNIVEERLKKLLNFDVSAV